MHQDQPIRRIPVSFVTGFLGSGKTTLISALLRQPDMAGTAIVVNEFGAVGLDDAIFAQTTDEDDVKLLANGCMCCVADDDLSVTLLQLTRRTERLPTRIVIETTGLADPANLLHKIMADPRLRRYVRLDGVITTVDAVNGLGTLRDEAVARRQVAMADRRIITKTDLTDPAAVATLEARLHALNAGADILRVTHGEISAGKLFGLSLIDATTGKADLNRWLNSDAHKSVISQAHHDQGDGSTHVHFSGGHDHGDGMGTWLIEESRPVDWDLLSPRIGAIVERFGELLLRLKGVVWTCTDQRPLVIHGVQRIYHAPVRLDKWPGTPRTALVAIGSEGAQIAVDSLKSALQDCATDTLEASHPKDIVSPSRTRT